MAREIAYPRLEEVGRLGNQLWQIAGTLGLARANGVDPAFPAKWSYRRFYSVPAKYFYDDLGGFRTTEDVLGEFGDPRSRPYLQDLRLWADVQDEVRDWFRASVFAAEILAQTEVYRTLMDARHADVPTISLHVRRGDNTYNWQHYWLPTIEYYHKALVLLPSIAPIFVFSDDPSWCHHVLRPALPDRSVTIYHGQTRPREDEPNYWSAAVNDWPDLFLQALATHHVISNSTYSWWGAWLSGDPAPIYPSQWYGPAITWMEPERMFPKEWRMIDVPPRTAP